MKKHTNLNLDSELVEQAKSKGYSLSEIAENAIREALGKKNVEIDNEAKECEFCNREMRKATAKNLNGLTWLYPAEKWICPKCLRKEASIWTKSS